MACKFGFVNFVSTYCVGTVKKLDYNRYSQLTRWGSGNASVLGAKGHGFNFRLRQGFLCLMFFVLLLLWLLLFVQKAFFVTKFRNSFCYVKLFSILNILQDGWPIIRVKRYRPSIFKGQFETNVITTHGIGIGPSLTIGLYVTEFVTKSVTNLS